MPPPPPPPLTLPSPPRPRPLQDYLAPALGITDVQIEMLADNNEIMSSTGLLRSECSASDTLCIGAAAISITEAREENFDFLSSYFTNNVRLMTPVSADPTEILQLIVAAVWQLILGLVLISALFCLVLTPIVWAVEMLGAGASPIFLPARGSKPLILQSFKAAAIWTVMTFSGSQLARPNAPLARAVLLPLLSVGTRLVGVVATAAMAAIFTLDASKASAISGVSDLTTRHIVCYNSASSFNTAFVTGLASEKGFQAIALSSLAATFDAFFASACDAMIYDETLLQGELIHRRQTVLTDSPQYERVQKAGVVGESLKWDP